MPFVSGNRVRAFRFLLHFKSREYNRS